MENHLEYLTIENFKSIKQAHFECSKVNVFIGKPNTGKSNILEAISLLGDPNYGLKHIRIVTPTNLFYDNDISKSILIETNLFLIEVDNPNSQDRYTLKFFYYDRSSKQKHPQGGIVFSSSDIFTKNLLSSSPALKRVHRYLFDNNTEFTSGGPNYLEPPSGKNLVSILSQWKELHKYITSYLNEYGYKLKINIHEKRLSLQKDSSDYIVYEIPFEIIAETLKRITFHLMAIKTNKKAIICLEEPEAHIYAPYIRDIVEAIADDETNQFFIATHSSSFLVDLLERVPQNLRLFVVYFENFETKIKQVSDEEISKYLTYGQDFFYHLDELVSN